MSPGTLMSRAEKFEDEKKRIIESCFGKRETDGSSMLRNGFCYRKGGLSSRGLRTGGQADRFFLE